MKARAFALAAASVWMCSAAHAQSQPVSPTIEGLMNQGYEIKAASANGLTQFLYLQGVDGSGRKKAYACQLQFGSNGGFQGCLALP